jgi:hypothetical protein
MTYKDSNVGVCDHCADGDSWIVGEDEDGRFCDKCEEVTDDDLVFGNGWSQKLAVLAIIGIVIGHFLYFGLVVAAGAKQ